MITHKLDTDTQVFFYEQEFYVLSNFSAFSLWWRKHLFPTSEHAYQWEKFAYLDGHTASERKQIKAEIKYANSAHRAFKIAEQHRGLVHPEWAQIRVATMRQILLAKVGQHEYVKRKLLETGNREIVEDSWRDGFWGWGEDKKGHNMLGKLWMEIRAAIQERNQ